MLKGNPFTAFPFFLYKKIQTINNKLIYASYFGHFMDSVKSG